jgi:hypothetical protein
MQSELRWQNTASRRRIQREFKQGRSLDKSSSPEIRRKNGLFLGIFQKIEVFFEKNKKNALFCWHELKILLCLL